MGAAETTGIVVITVALIQGLVGLIRYLIKRQKDGFENDAHSRVYDKLERIENKVGTECGLNDNQGSQLSTIYNLLVRTDSEGTPLVYFPRASYGETQRVIVERLQTVSEVQLKMLGIIERLERRLELFDNPGGL